MPEVRLKTRILSYGWVPGGIQPNLHSPDQTFHQQGQLPDQLGPGRDCADLFDRPHSLWQHFEGQAELLPAIAAAIHQRDVVRGQWQGAAREEALEEGAGEESEGGSMISLELILNH